MPAEERFPLVSVVIPFHNAAGTIKETICSLLSSDYPRIEIICVNDRSDDDSEEKIAEFPVTLISLIRRSGAAVARNIGVSAAKGEIIFFIDSDVAAMPDTVGRIVRTFQRNKGIDACFGEYTALPITRNFATVYKNLVHHFTHQNARTEAHTFWCGCGAIRTDAFRAIGGFDESYLASSVEDIELGYRLTESGRRVLLNKEIRVSHAKVYTLRSLIRSDFRDRAIPWTLLMARKNVFYADLNLKASNVLSALALVLFLPLSIAGVAVFGFGLAGYAFIAAVIFYVALNGPIFRFVYRKMGLAFTFLFAGMYTLTYLYSVVGFAVGVFLYLKEKSGRSRGA